MRLFLKPGLEFSACDVPCVWYMLIVHIMRTNIDIDDSTLEAAMRAGPFKTKKEAVEAGLKLLARQAAYREILKWEGKLPWDGDDDADSRATPAQAAAGAAQGHPTRPYVKTVSKPRVSRSNVAAKKGSHGRR
jgi:antitoxin ParD1/3/4